MLVLGTSAGRILKAEGKFCDRTNHAACLAYSQVIAAWPLTFLAY